jgi:Ca2+-binding RTX toxin-like protein
VLDGIGNDVLHGGGENDVLIGDVGRDLLRGGLGKNTPHVGSGADRFDFNATSEGVDTDLTFALGADKIDLSTVFAATGSVVNAGNLAEFVQTSSAASDTDGFLSMDANGFVGGSSFVTIALVDNVTPAQLSSTRTTSRCRTAGDPRPPPGKCRYSAAAAVRAASSSARRRST